MSGPDAATVVVYDNENDSVRLYSNARDRGTLEEMLSEFLRSQMGKGEDAREPNRQPIYTIKIGLWFEDDYFQMNHDCGNDGLAVGIVMHALKEAKTAPLGDLAEFLAGEKK